MKKIVCLGMAAMLALAGCSGGSQTPATQPAATEAAPTQEAAEAVEPTTIYPIFPATDGPLIGDTMPYFEDGVMNVFYLADMRDNKPGYHPWGLMHTEDYCNYTDEGIVIPYGESGEAQDLALGTGCVIRDQDGLYHAFYTGHNDHYAPKEAVMHATSTDKLSWTKVPEDTFTGDPAYSVDDFRDPYVFWVEEDSCYWMLVVTRQNDQGVIARYTSTDLSKWEDAGVFFADDMGNNTNLECPSVLEYKGKWYLAFSDQWPDRVVHYRVADSLKGEFLVPDGKDYFDGNGFYAGRLETDGENLYLVGWNGTKVGHDDYNDYDWGGNMVIHQLEQQEDGTLRPVVNPKVAAALSNPRSLTPVLTSDGVEGQEGSWKFSGNEYEVVQFEALSGSDRLEADVSGVTPDALFGISFAPDDEQRGGLNFVFNEYEGRIEFYNTEDFTQALPQSYVPFDFAGKDSFHVTMLAYGGVVALYVDGESVLTARMYRSQFANWQLFSENAPVAWEQVELYN